MIVTVDGKDQEVCCANFGAALQLKTDWEMYGSAIHDNRAWDLGWGIGLDLPPITYCPWCAVQLSLSM